MADIGAELLEKIRAEFQKTCKADKYIQSVLKKIEGGTAKMEEVALFSKRLGLRASQAIGAYVNASALPDGKMYYNIADTILMGVLKDNYDIINSAAAECQKALDRTAGINITPQQAEFPTETCAGGSQCSFCARYCRRSDDTANDSSGTEHH